jgi:hypothetical protein
MPSDVSEMPRGRHGVPRHICCLELGAEPISSACSDRAHPGRCRARQVFVLPIAIDTVRSRPRFWVARLWPYPLLVQWTAGKAAADVIHRFPRRSRSSEREFRLVAPNGYAGPVWRCPLIGADRKWPAARRTDAIDPQPTSGGSRKYYRWFRSSKLPQG